MALKQQPGPGYAFQKVNGNWTFHVYPNGAPQEAGEYASEEAAKEASHKVLLIWEANGFTYGPAAAIVSRTFLVD